MRRATHDEVKAIQISILDAVVRFCEENNISYWLDAGTLLGAVRHKGYIPWDDDIDVGMLRPDYDRFIATFNLSNERYKAYSYENNPDFLFVSTKVLDTETLLYEPDKDGLKLCINIDVFAYDNAPADDKLLKRQYRVRDFYRKLHIGRAIKSRPNGSWLRRTAITAARKIIWVIPKDFCLKQQLKNAKKYSSVDTGYIGDFTSFSIVKCRKEAFASFVDVEFEGKYYKAPVGYDEWLSELYGDYMQLPPPEKRVSHHTYEAYVLE